MRLSTPSDLPALSLTLPPAVVATPAPAPIHEISGDWARRFNSLVSVERVEVKSYFAQFPHYERFNENHPYSVKPFWATYSGTLRQYDFHLYRVNGSEYYVVARELPDDCRIYLEFCPCLICQLASCNPLKYWLCPHCHGCLAGGMISVNRQYLERAKQRTRPGLGWIRTMEVIFIVVVMVLIYYK